MTPHEEQGKGEARLGRVTLPDPHLLSARSRRQATWNLQRYRLFVVRLGCPSSPTPPGLPKPPACGLLLFYPSPSSPHVASKKVQQLPTTGGSKKYQKKKMILGPGLQRIMMVWWRDPSIECQGRGHGGGGECGGENGNALPRPASPTAIGQKSEETSSLSLFYEFGFAPSPSWPGVARDSRVLCEGRRGGIVSLHWMVTE